ncbi:MAG: acyl-CoA desaturase [Cytophagaceae bacterium]|jgi:linoleoyl-CoA desaturase|nr:acyl-CoA desaturase [Cytophagaceae bacterium]
MKNLKIRFSSRDAHKQEFYSTLRHRIDHYFTENKRTRFFTAEMVVKTVVLLLAYLVPFAAVLFYDWAWYMAFGWWTIMGIAQAGIGMSIMHDANHGAYSSNSFVNRCIGHSLTLIGGSVYNWKLQHNLLHHTYTNIAFVDDDIADKLILRFSPHTPTKWIHKFQWVYAFLLYCIMTVYWVFLKDFIQFFTYQKEGVCKGSVQEVRVSFVKLILGKLFYFFVFLVVPIWFLEKEWWSYLLGYLWMHNVTGLILTVIFQMAHTVEETEHPLPNEINQIENTWAIHQMNTTANFSPNNRWLSWFVGGLNYQIEHHLFPTICHVHYPAIAPIVKATAQEFGVPYLQNDSFIEAFKSHVTTLKRFGG